jgi:hypothetical protein
MNNVAAAREIPTAKKKRSIRSNYQRINDVKGASREQLNRTTGNCRSNGQGTSCRTSPLILPSNLRDGTVVNQSGLFDRRRLF